MCRRPYALASRPRAPKECMDTVTCQKMDQVLPLICCALPVCRMPGQQQPCGQPCRDACSWGYVAAVTHTQQHCAGAGCLCWTPTCHPGSACSSAHLSQHCLCNSTGVTDSAQSLKLAPHIATQQKSPHTCKTVAAQRQPLHQCFQGADLPIQSLQWPNCKMHAWGSARAQAVMGGTCRCGELMREASVWGMVSSVASASRRAAKTARQPDRLAAMSSRSCIISSNSSSLHQASTNCQSVGCSQSHWAEGGSALRSVNTSLAGTG